MTTDSRRLTLFGTNSSVSDSFNCAPTHGLLPGKVALHWPEMRGGRDISLAVCIVRPAVRALIVELKFGLRRKA